MTTERYEREMGYSKGKERMSDAYENMSEIKNGQ